MLCKRQSSPGPSASDSAAPARALPLFAMLHLNLHTVAVLALLLVVAVPGVPGQATFQMGEADVNACPLGSTPFATKAACQAAYTPGAPSFNEGSWPTGLKGCYLATGSGLVLFNTHATGAATVSAAAKYLICEPPAGGPWNPTCTDTDYRQTDYYCGAGLVFNAAAIAVPGPSDATCCVNATCAATDKYGRPGYPFDCPTGTSFVASNSAATSPDATTCCTAPTGSVTAPVAGTTEAATTAAATTAAVPSTAESALTAAATTAAAATTTEAATTAVTAAATTEATATTAVVSAEAKAAKTMTFTYSTVDCAVVSGATIASACVALTAETTAQYPAVAISSCSGACGSLVLQLQIDGNVADADIAAAEAAISANPSSVAIALATTDGATLNLSPSAVMFQGVAAQPMPAATGKKGKKKGKKGNKGKKGRHAKGNRTAAKKGSSNAAKTGKGKRAKSAKQSLTEETAETPAARTQTYLVLLVGLLGVVGVAIGLRKSAAQERSPAEPTEKSPLVAA